MPNWPAGIPFFTDMAGATRTGPQGAVLRSQMEYGPAKVRRRTSSAPRGFSGSVSLLTMAQVATFEAFFATDLLNGARSFQAVDPLSGVPRSYRFLDSYTITAMTETTRRITADLEILP